MLPLHAGNVLQRTGGLAQPKSEPVLVKQYVKLRPDEKRLHEVSRRGEGQRKRRRLLAPKRVLKTLLIDNFDSYTYNLYQLLAVVNGGKALPAFAFAAAPAVVRNSDLSWRDLSQRLSQGEYDNVVISPGPGTPLRPSDLGICQALLEEAEDVPILGVCLGMQALAHVHGGQVVPAPCPIHGRLSEIRHTSNPIFAGIPSGKGRGFEVVRYHSLAVREETLPLSLEPLAWTCGAHHAVDLHGSVQASSSCSEAELEGGLEDRVLMGLAHRTRPHWGVQFHPESVATRYGTELLQNFASCTQAVADSRGAQTLPDPRLLRSSPASQPTDEQQNHRDTHQEADPNMDVRWQVLRGKLEGLGGSEAMFWHLFGGQGAEDTFWLDSASQDGQRFSYMGGRGGSLWQRITFQLAPPSSPHPSTPAGTAEASLPPTESPLRDSGVGQGSFPPGMVNIKDSKGEERCFPSHFLDYLEGELLERRVGDSGLPFDFTGGYVGYLAYELKAECGSPGRHVSPHPDAAMFFSDRLVVVDHATNDVYIVALHRRRDAQGIAAADEWLASTQAALQQLRHQEGVPKAAPPSASHVEGAADASIAGQAPVSRTRDCTGEDWEECVSAEGSFESRRSREGYTADIGSCLEALHAGESYELCLTTKLRKSVAVDPRSLYSELRASNPSAHAAWLSFGDDLPTICCSSPERFLRGCRDGTVEARPIKGTARRYVSPQLDQQSKDSLLSSAKAKAENLMIVDLLRNDLGRFCEVGSVHVPGLMEVETYATVHNLVSTVRGMRRKGTSVVDCLRASFPGGSMTGAPKLRSMEFLDRLENGPRGVYSGSLGFIGLNNTFDLNIVIRTAVVEPGQVTIGAGGAIVMQSDPQDEYEEMRLKARALMKAVEKCAKG